MIKRLIEWHRRSCQMRKTKRLKEQAARIYQVRELDGLLWLTCDGALVLPSYMLNTDILRILTSIRALYVERNTKKQ